MNDIVQHHNFTRKSPKSEIAKKKTFKISLLIRTYNIENKYTKYK